MESSGREFDFEEVASSTITPRDLTANLLKIRRRRRAEAIQAILDRKEDYIEDQEREAALVKRIISWNKPKLHKN